MKSTITFTSTLSIEMARWLKRYSQKEHSTQRAIIEEALKKYRAEVKRKELAESFKRASQDKDMNKMAEEGLDDYIHQLKSS